VSGAERHLGRHLGGALAAVALLCGLPPLAAVLLGPRWPLLLVPLLATPFLFVGLLVARIAAWLRAPVPFRVPLTLGQQRALPGLPRRGRDNPRSLPEVWSRALLDLLWLRPLVRATPTAPALGPGLSHGMDRTLWLGAGLFHLALGVVGLRHLRFVLAPVPAFVAVVTRADLATEMLLPGLHASTVLLPAALLFLLGRRLCLPRLRHLSLAADYFPLCMLLAVATSGIVLRHVVRADVTLLKEQVLGLVAGRWLAPAQLDLWLLVHVTLVAALLVYLPMSKLVHMASAPLVPTLTLANHNRERRHVNPRNPRVTTLTYADYETRFHERMLAAGLPVEKD
jgi:nitrate reductase gamma subunit